MVNLKLQPGLLKVNTNSRFARNSPFYRLKGSKSRVLTIDLTFSQPVMLDPELGATLGRYLGTYRINDFLYNKDDVPNWVPFGTNPNSYRWTTYDFTTWSIYFTGEDPSTVVVGADGSFGLKDGIYTVGAFRFWALGDSGRLGYRSEVNFCKLFGETQHDPTRITPVGADPALPDYFGKAFYQASVNSIDNLAFRATFNKSSGQDGYNPEFDNDGTGNIGSADSLDFRTNFGKTVNFLNTANIVYDDPDDD